MKFSLYGLPCAGKTKIMKGLKTPVIHGSTELNQLASGRFAELSNEEKKKVRIKYAKRLSERDGSFIADGHYSFLDDVVFTEADAALYDVFIYLYCEPCVICKRLQSSAKNEKFSLLSEEHIKKWQSFEIEALRRECHKRNKDFYVVRDISAVELQDFIDRIEGGFGSFAPAERIAEMIKEIYPEPCELHICDGDKTIIEKDSFGVCTNNYKTNVFDGDFYTGYQSLKFSMEIAEFKYDLEKLNTVKLNDMVFSRIRDKSYVVLSSGVFRLWERLSEKLSLKNIIADTLISADTKYYVVKLLREQGYTITAYGDGKNDLYMLREADKGFLVVGTRLSRSLREADTSGIRLLYDKYPFILENVRNDIENDIAVCRSGSGISGARLAEVHYRLGRKLGEQIRELVPSVDTAVIVLERGGRFFGDGLYMGFGGTFYSVDPKKDGLPEISQGAAVIVDSVINTGRSVLGIISTLKTSERYIEIYIAANVIQEKALELLSGYKIFAVRTSENCFVGSCQAVQKDGRGPDTADRLFNYIK